MLNVKYKNSKFSQKNKRLKNICIYIEISIDIIYVYTYICNHENRR